MDLHLATFQLSNSHLGSRVPRGAQLASTKRLGRVFAPRTAGGSAGRARTREVFTPRADAGDNAAVDTAAPGGAVIDVTDENFDSLVLESPVPVIVDFWAPWCGPCRMIAPLIESLAEEYGDKAVCAKLNTDECASTANKYGIRSIPTVILFKGGAQVETVVGAVPMKTLKQTIDRYVE